MRWLTTWFPADSGAAADRQALAMPSAIVDQRVRVVPQVATKSSASEKQIANKERIVNSERVQLPQS
jgi:hypothetical protein